MAIIKKHSRNDSSNHYGARASYAASASVKATCYIVDDSQDLKAFHYSSTGAGGPEWYS